MEGERPADEASGTSKPTKVGQEAASLVGRQGRGAPVPTAREKAHTSAR